MSSDLDDYRVPTRKTPWFLILVLLGAAGGAGYMAWNEHKKTADDESQIATLEAKLKDLDIKQKESAAKADALDTENKALKSAKEELSKDVAAKDDELSKLKGTYDELHDKLKSELSSGDVLLTTSGGKLRVDLVDKILFNSGEAQVSKRGENVLQRVGKILAAIPDRQIQVSGHTDQLPIGEKRSAQFPTNWELSVARATNVVRFLQEKAGVPGERLVASGYSEYHPVASNKTSAGRARNRRIEILLTPEVAPKAIGKDKLKEVAKAGSDAKPAAKVAKAAPPKKKHR